MPTIKDFELLMLLSKRKKLDATAVIKSLIDFSKYEEQKAQVTIEDVLVKNKIIDYSDVQFIHNTLKRRIIFCSCGAKYNVFKMKPNDIFNCQKCRNVITVPVAERKEIKKYIAEYGVYKIIRQFSEGGMGKVFLALKSDTNENVVIKTIHKKLSNNNQFVQRFVREMRALAKIQHPNIVKFIDEIVESDFLGYAMEFIKGDDLSVIIKKRKEISFNIILQVAVQILDALKFLHDNKFVHRDIKPNNIIMDENCKMILVDFGLVKGDNLGPALTLDGMAMGTPYFISPEQSLDTKYANDASDRFSLGATLYYICTAEYPFTGKTAIEILKNVKYKEPSNFSNFREDIPFSFEKWVFTLLSKKPEDRFKNDTDALNKLVRSFPLAKNYLQS